jgi:hypothetical protein
MVPNGESEQILRRIVRVFQALLWAILRNKAVLAGAILFFLLFPVLLVSTLLDLQGGIENPYFSLLLYLVLGPLLLIAVLLIITGLLFARKWKLREKGSEIYTYEFLKEQLTNPEQSKIIRRFVYSATSLVSIFLFLMVIFAHTGHRYTDSVQFCGNFCHTVMEPQFVTHRNSPHSQVRCVACHIGKEAGGLTGAKLSGLKQLYATVTDTYPRPLKPPVENLRPSRDTCEECHRPEKFHGHKLYFLDTFLADEMNSHVQTAMIMKIGSGGHLGRSAHGIHWHTSEQHQLFYTAADSERRQINSIILLGPGGESTTFFREGRSEVTEGLERLMDCIDCHNRPTHVFRSPEEALDLKLLNGQIPTELPYVKREALVAVTRNYASTRDARAGIAERLQQWYTANYHELTTNRPELLAAAVAGAQQAYEENVFPEMKIGWETYPSCIEHQHGGGCFRCHNDLFKSADGRVISRDCTLCHIILAEKQPVEKVLQKITDFNR